MKNSIIFNNGKVILYFAHTRENNRFSEMLTTHIAYTCLPLFLTPPHFSLGFHRVWLYVPLVLYFGRK